MKILGTDPKTAMAPAQVREAITHIVEEFMKNMDGVDFAQLAYARAIEASTEPDALRAQNKLREAEIMVKLSLRDAICEATAALKEMANRKIAGAA